MPSASRQNVIKEFTMATEPTNKDTAALDAKIKELMKRSQSLDASADEAQKAADEAKAAAGAKAKELDDFTKRSAAAAKNTAKQAARKK
jgi:hypothetical protein